MLAFFDFNLVLHYNRLIDAITRLFTIISEVLAISLIVVIVLLGRGWR